MTHTSLPLFTFVESRVFTATAVSAGIVGSVRDVLERELLANPLAGAVVADTGGARKIRVKLPGRGKSAGARMLYYYAVRREVIHLIIAYPKGVQENVTDEQKRMMRAYIARIDAG